MKIKIEKSVTILFQWNGESHTVGLQAKDFSRQLDRFYAYFRIGNDLFYFEDDLDGGLPVLAMPGVWFSPAGDAPEEQYFWKPEDLRVLSVDGRPVELINNGR